MYVVNGMATYTARNKDGGNMGSDSLIGKIFGWMFHPLNDDSSPTEWLAGLLLIIIVSFLWAQVIRMIE